MKNPLEKNSKTTDEKIDYIISLIGGLATKAELAEKFEDSRKYTDEKIDSAAKTTDEKIDDLAIMTGNSFADQGKELSVIKERVAVVEEVTKNTRQDVLNISDKFVSRTEFDNHVVKFGNLERKVSQITQ